MCTRYIKIQSNYSQTFLFFNFLQGLCKRTNDFIYISTGRLYGRYAHMAYPKVLVFVHIVSSVQKKKNQSRVMLTFDIYMQTSCNDDPLFQKTRYEIARCDVWRKIESCHSVGSYGVIDWDLFQS